MSDRIRTVRRILSGFVVFLGGLLILGLVPLAVHSLYNPFQFNQFLIQRLDLKLGIAPRAQLLDGIRSSFSSGLNILSGAPKQVPNDFDDTLKMFGYIFSWLPSYAVVYPTEGFYYFTTSIPDVGPISGNVRVADLDKGLLSMAYFTVAEANRQTRMRNILSTDGLEVKKLSAYRYEVKYQSKTVLFKLPERSQDEPLNFAKLPEEEYVGRVYDESGVQFLLVYNHLTTSFYYLLDERAGHTESYDQVTPSVLLGRRTAFVYFQEPHYPRKFLVGVLLDNIKANNFYDGPGDQVPFRANLREKLHMAYPNTLLGHGIDEHGVYLQKAQWQRIAISPYHRYASVTEVLEKMNRCEPNLGESEYWTCLTKEWWNHEAWRRGIYAKLKSEGKVVQ